MILLQRRNVLLALALVSSSLSVNAFTGVSKSVSSQTTISYGPEQISAYQQQYTTGPLKMSAQEPAIQNAPVLNGKMVLPLKILIISHFCILEPKRSQTLHQIVV